MYVYNPDTYNLELMELKKLNNEDFVFLQAKYRESIEALFKKFYNFKKIDTMFEKLEIAPLMDSNYNFYHKFSTLESKYVFLRNNYHIEKLQEAEINLLRSCILNETFLPNDFIMKTASRVILEEENNVCYNSVIPENFVLSQSFVFEFAYDMNKCKSIKQIKEAEAIMKSIFDEIQEVFLPKLSIPLSLVIYTATPDIFLKEEFIN